jgi:hypothetical protein
MAFDRPSPLNDQSSVKISVKSEGNALINPVTGLSNQSLDRLSQSNMLYYYISEIANVNAVFCDAGDGDGGGGGGDGDHQNDGYDNDALFSMTFPDDPLFQ